MVTTGLLHALSADERRVLLAHEASHLLHRHAWWLLAAAANPLLCTTATARCVERWADENAAATVRDRRLAARALARTALLIRDPEVGAQFALPAAGGDIPARVRALLAPPPRSRPRAVPSSPSCCWSCPPRPWSCSTVASNCSSTPAATHR